MADTQSNLVTVPKARNQCGDIVSSIVPSPKHHWSWCHLPKYLLLKNSPALLHWQL